MKANEAKSKFVYPDKLYARTNDNMTLDISYAPQTLDAIEYTRTDTFIEKACEWLKENGGSYWMDDYDLPTDELVNDFKTIWKESKVWEIIFFHLTSVNTRLACAEISVGGLIMAIPDSLCGGIFIKMIK